MQAILLAAGFGTRLRPYSLIRPKPLFPVLNRPLIHHLLDMLLEAGCLEIVVNTHHLGRQIYAALDNYPQVTVQMESEILGTGGSLRLALQSLDHNKSLLVMNGDIVHNIDLEFIYDAHLRSGNMVTMVMHDYPRFNSVNVDGELVTSFRSGKREGKENLAFTGIHVVNPEVIRQIPEHGFFHIIDLYEQLAGRGQVGVERVDMAFWQDIGTLADYLDLHRELLTSDDMFSMFSNPFSICRDNWLIGRDVHIGSGVKLLDWGCLGDGVRVGDGAVLRRSVIWDGVKVSAGENSKDDIMTGNISYRLV